MPALVFYLIATFVFGMLYCFYGRRYFYPLLMLNVIVNSVSSAISARGSGFFTILISLVVGIILAVLARIFYKFALFLVGLSAGAVLGMLVAAALVFLIGPFSWVLVVAIALLFAICAVVWSDAFIIISTALKGSSMIISSIGFFLFNASTLNNFILPEGALATITNLKEYINIDLVAAHPFIIGLATAILFISGWIYQVKDRRRFHF